jgi:hypothetical protein
MYKLWFRWEAFRNDRYLLLYIGLQHVLSSLYTYSVRWWWKFPHTPSVHLYTRLLKSADSEFHFYRTCCWYQNYQLPLHYNFFLFWKILVYIQKWPRQCHSGPRSIKIERLLIRIPSRGSMGNGAVLWLMLTLCADICIKDLNMFLSVSFRMKVTCVHFSKNKHFILVMFPVSLRHWSEFCFECLHVYVVIFKKSKNLTELLQLLVGKIFSVHSFSMKRNPFCFLHSYTCPTNGFLL